MGSFIFHACLWSQVLCWCVPGSIPRSPWWCCSASVEAVYAKRSVQLWLPTNNTLTSWEESRREKPLGKVSYQHLSFRAAASLLYSLEGRALVAVIKVGWLHTAQKLKYVNVLVSFLCTPNLCHSVDLEFQSVLAQAWVNGCSCPPSLISFSSLSRLEYWPLKQITQVSTGIGGETWSVW